MPASLDFIYVGAPKSGSTWLFEALREHPQAWLIPSKSSGYFETDTPGPVEAYLELLGEGAGRVTGEIAHDAYLFDGTAARLHALFPQVKVIVCLREPGEFARSTFKWWTTHTDRFGTTVGEMARNRHFRSLMDYQARLAPFFALFPPEQIKVVFYDDLVADPARFHSEICRFVGLDPSYRPAVLTSMINQSRPARFAAVTRAAYAAGGTARKLGFGKVVEVIKRLPPVESLLYAKRDALPDAEILAACTHERQAARASFPALEALIGQTLPQSWKQA